MPARCLLVDDDPLAAIAAAAAVLRRGGLVVLPTESSYGIAADPHAVGALGRLVRLKGRAAHKPLPLVAASAAAARGAGDVPPALQPLVEAFWPGPLTVALQPPAAAAWSPLLLGGGSTLGVRVSDHFVAQGVAAAAGGLITATSANLSGQPAAQAATALDPFVASQVDLVLDAGTLPTVPPSTVVAARGAQVLVLRLGAIEQAALEAALQGPVVLV